MQPGERFRNYLEGLSESWKDRARGWVAHALENGVTRFIELIEPDAIDEVRATLTRIHDDPNTPGDIKNLIDKVTTPGHPLPLLIVIPVAIAMILPMIFSLAQPLGRLFEYQEDKLLHSARLDPATVIQAWLRDKAAGEHFFQDLRDLGWNEDRISAVKELSNIIPGVQDLVRMSVREAFSPEIAEKFGQYQDPPTAVYPWAEKLGLSKEWVDRYWAAHWELPSTSDGFEMLHRGIMTEDDLKLLLRALDVMPYWRDKLINLSWNVPTRVDVRRFWDMRTIDETRLREVYTGLGYHGQDLEDYVLWTKIYVDFPDLLARYKNGWIEIEDVKKELVAMGMKPERAETLIQEKMKNAAIERTITERDLTKADIVSGVKKNVITRAEGTELLISIGYSADEAEYILAVGVPQDDEDATQKARELTKSDIAAAVKEEIITPAQAITKLMALRYKEADATFLSQIYAAQIPIEKVEPQRELTKSDIMGALKNGIISPGEATTMLTDLRYSPEDIALLIKSNTPAPEKIAEEKLRQVDKGDIKSALKAGTITGAEATSRLTALNYSAVDATFLVDLYQRLEEIKQITKPKEASKADIVTAVKKGLITPEEGYTMLINLDFTPGAANFILSIVAESSPFSPMSYGEFKEITDKWKIATVLGGKPVTEEIKKLGAEVARLSDEVAAIERRLKEERGTLVPTGELPPAAMVRVQELQATLSRAQAELSRVKTDYNTKVAEWRHAGAK